jgi:hypothetical protein
MSLRQLIASVIEGTRKPMSWMAKEDVKDAASSHEVSNAFQDEPGAIGELAYILFRSNTA